MRLRSSLQPSLRALVFVVLAVCFVDCHAATAANYQLGKEYSIVPQPQPPADSKTIEVEEFFCYCGPGCYYADPLIEKWRHNLPASVHFTRVPDSLGRDDGKILEQAFYVAEVLGVSQKVHWPLFEAVYLGHQRITSLDQVQGIFTDFAGVKPAAFDATAGSIVVGSDMRKADSKAMAYRITSVPSVVVGGKYVALCGQDGLLKLVDFLINKVRNERQSSYAQ